MNEQILHARLFGRVELCAHVIEIAGQRLEPDTTKAYCDFRLCHAWPSITAYGTSFHPGTLANSWPSLQHQVFNLGHKMRAYDQSAERKEIPRDYMLGSIVAVEFPQPPGGGWRLGAEMDKAPSVRAAGVIHKMAEKVPAVMGEHQSGRHKWTVSIEVDYSLKQSGFVVGNRAAAKKKTADLLAETTPAEFDALGLGYVPMEAAPEELFACYNFKKRAVTQAWEGLPVTLLKGGVNGQVHFMGVGLVRYGAEREAEIQSLLASDPESVLLEEEELGLAELRNYFGAMAANGESLIKLLTPRRPSA